MVVCPSKMGFFMIAKSLESPSKSIKYYQSPWKYRIFCPWSFMDFHQTKCCVLMTWIFMEIHEDWWFYIWTIMKIHAFFPWNSMDVHGTFMDCHSQFRLKFFFLLTIVIIPDMLGDISYHKALFTKFSWKFNCDVKWDHAGWNDRLEILGFTWKMDQGIRGNPSSLGMTSKVPVNSLFLIN